ncbi:dihydrofolate reductase [Balneola vulgaris]|uniref:dihydrofolate reductase n=1 Tax=Balneola vulgaris TaxID=287535 RepID=UPI00037B1D08|nr:dihydrofolate reductase [Balneola vulgaris]
MILTIVVAHDPNLVIGKEGGLPWRYPEDLKHFKKTTLGGTMIMGRGVFEELNEIPLPGRKNIVLSTTKTYDNIDTFTSLEAALESLNEEEVFIIGGGVLYRQAIKMADKMVVTQIKKEYDGDTYFPEYRNEVGKVWLEVSRDETDDLIFLEYKRAEL